LESSRESEQIKDHSLIPSPLSSPCSKKENKMNPQLLSSLQCVHVLALVQLKVQSDVKSSHSSGLKALAGLCDSPLLL